MENECKGCIHYSASEQEFPNPCADCKRNINADFYIQNDYYEVDPIRESAGL